MILLDTNIVSELMRPRPNPRIVDWIASQLSSTLYISAVSEAELRYGLEIMPMGRRRERLSEQLEGMLRWDFFDRLLPFDSAAAHAYAAIAATRRADGRSVNIADCQIAAIALSRGATVATRNVDDFQESVPHVINPWAV